MVEEGRCQSRGGLLDDIKRGSRLLDQQLLRFMDWIGDRKIVSFIEMQQTKKLQKVRLQAQSTSNARGRLADCEQQPDGTWARTGEYITVVSKDSALLGFSQAVEERVEVEGDHASMVKFSSWSSLDYAKTLDSLHRFEREAKAVLEKRFCSGK